MSIVFKLGITLALVFLICYPFTSLIGSCASYPLEDFFFPVYWPLAYWLNHQGVSVVWANPLAVIVPNTIIVYLSFKLFTFVRYKHKKQ